MQSDEIIEAMQREYKMNRSTVYNYIKKVKKNG
jgi:predicted transcriptional regulator YheO